MPVLAGAATGIIDDVSWDAVQAQGLRRACFADRPTLVASVEVVPFR
jgi:hypothetical protein